LAADGVHREAAGFALVLPARGSLLAVDASRRRLGLAGTDPDRRLVTPLVTLARRAAAADLASVAARAAERAAVGLVLGWPLNMDGSEGPMARAAAALADRLAARTGLPVLLQDERLTSFAVADAIAEGRVRRPRPGQPTDHLAAAVILEDALRALAGPPKPA
jgi:putative Holliday junction resolvase